MQLQVCGIDLDSEALSQLRARLPAPVEQFTLRCQDAWDFASEDRYDIVVSNGLTIYEPDDARCISLYRKIAQHLAPDGIFVFSFLSHPPSDDRSEWIAANVSKDAARLQLIILSGLLNIRWQQFRSTDQIRQQCVAAGLRIREIRADAAYIFPTVVAGL
jgi:2-polyprenyl-3-methyl-5-hydroxy-6-metoxy-1,4-benzoquinol methylase